jgi:hypothetical protein
MEFPLTQLIFKKVEIDQPSVSAYLGVACVLVPHLGILIVNHRRRKAGRLLGPLRFNSLNFLLFLRFRRVSGLFLRISSARMTFAWDV